MPQYVAQRSHQSSDYIISYRIEGFIVSAVDIFARLLYLLALSHVGLPHVEHPDHHLRQLLALHARRASQQGPAKQIINTHGTKNYT